MPVTRLADGTPGQETAALDDALASAEMSEAMSVELDATEAPVAGPAPNLRAPGGDDALMLEVPDAGPEWEHVVLEIDEGGVMRWHLPLTDDNQVAPPATRGAGAMKRFRIPRAVAPTPVGDGQTRGLVGLVGKKLLKVLVYPVTDVLLGHAVDLFAAKWEAKKRPYGLRLMTPDNYATPGAPQLTADAPLRQVRDDPIPQSGRGVVQIPQTEFAQRQQRLDALGPGLADADQDARGERHARASRRL